MTEQERSRLAAIVEEQARQSLEITLRRTVDRVIDSYADEMLRDATFKAEMLVLLREAFAIAIRQLKESAAADADDLKQ